MSWKGLAIKRNELNINWVLPSGQNFRWKCTNLIDEEWTGIINENLINLKQDSDQLYYRIIASRDPTIEKDPTQFIPILRDYFQLDLLNLENEYNCWSLKDDNFKQKSTKLIGVRMLRQDPIENVISFICSSNNNIKRITKMVDNLCVIYGDKIGEYQDEIYYSFPPLSRLADPSVEKKLRELGFGYRAKYIHQAAKLICQKDEDIGSSWLHTLRALPYLETHSALMTIPGVGPKVADCICLTSMDKHDAIPVDTHVWQIAIRDYSIIGSKTKTLTKSNYNKIGNYFRNLWGPYAGWAHSVLFTFDLSDTKKKLKK